MTRNTADQIAAALLRPAAERAARQAKFDAAAAELEKVRPYRTARVRLDQLDRAARPHPLQAVIAQMVA